MAIIQEHYMLNGVGFIRTYSDRNVLIHGGSPEADYSEANDPASLNRTYTETDIPIEDDDLDDSEALDIILGGEA